MFLTEYDENFLGKFQYEPDFYPTEVIPPYSYSEIECDIRYYQPIYMPWKFRNKTKLLGFEKDVRINISSPGKYIFFTSENGFSSSFCQPFFVNGRRYYSVTNYFIHEKLRFFGVTGNEHFGWQINSLYPDSAYEIGRQGITNFDEEEWDQISIHVMKCGSYYKYVQNKDLRRELFKTAGSILVDACFKDDNVWGTGMTKQNLAPSKSLKWKGKNQHGLILTCLRDYLMGLDKFKNEIENVTR